MDQSHTLVNLNVIFVVKVQVVILESNLLHW